MSEEQTNLQPVNKKIIYALIVAIFILIIVDPLLVWIAYIGIISRGSVLFFNTVLFVTLSNLIVASWWQFRAIAYNNEMGYRTL